jgi:hypothetical protein
MQSGSLHLTEAAETNKSGSGMPNKSGTASNLFWKQLRNTISPEIKKKISLKQ